ncbi:MAG: M56 family metallopeptidase, partial [Lachnospiraceae bacterium]|nr:M56 family metallopeptidase [Lachnospiraceae bacterium]
MVTFLEWMLESSLLVLMVLGIRKIFMGKVHYAAIYSLWIVVLLRFMIPVNFISTPVSVANLFEKSFSAWDQTKADAQSGGSDGVTSANPTSLESTGQLSHSEKIPGEDTFGVETDSSGRAFSGTEAVTENAGSVFAMLSSLSHWYPIWQYGKIVVTVLLLLWFLASNASLLRRIRAGRRFYGQKGNLKIYTVSCLQTPCLYGFIEPAIYLPKSLLTPGNSRSVSEDELEQMITHEYVHYQHRDHIWAMLRMLVVSIHWYNPFVWVAASYSKKDAELFCDETVIHMLGEENRFRYGRMLVRLAGNGRWGDFRYSMMLMSRRGKEMEGRIRAISGKRRYSKWMLLPLGAALVTAIAV